MAESNQVTLRYIPEVTYGTTPVDGTWQAIRYTSESLSGTPNTVTSSEIRSDRQVADQIKVGLEVSGGIDFELSATSYDDFIEAAMCGTWTTDVVTVGTTDRSFSLEKEFGDISRFVQLSGMRVGGMSLSLAYGSIITGSFTFAGNGVTTATTSLVGLGSTTAATTTGVLNASSDVGTVSIDGVATNICINSLNLNLDNGLRAIECIGSDAPKDQRKGTSNITGSVEMYLDTDSFLLYGDVLTQTAMSLEYTVTDGTNSYTFKLPNIKLSGEAPTSTGLDSDVMVSFDFTALQDATETALEITRA